MVFLSSKYTNLYARDQHLNSFSGGSSGTDISKWKYSEQVSKIDVYKKENF